MLKMRDYTILYKLRLNSVKLASSINKWKKLLSIINLSSLTGISPCYILLLDILYQSFLRGENMGKDFREERDLSEKEKRRIARELIKGYKKMAALNQKLAENGFIEDDISDEADF